MEKERAVSIRMDDQQYDLILTTGATKEIGARYGGIEKLGEKLMKSENFELALSEICWLICLLANQSILIHNFKNPGKQRDLLTEEAVELLTSPFDLASYKDAITEALFKGTARNITSEDSTSKRGRGKNKAGG